jgi:4,5-DOPA dioxygenase extradiol
MTAVIFIGHGSPMNAIEDNQYTKEWKAIAERIAKPKAILCISAHWYNENIEVSNSPSPETIHDFYGFPDELYEMTYSAKGSSELAQKVNHLIGARIDVFRGLDHGTWTVLKHMYPDADIPVIQLSINMDLTFKEHLELGKKLSKLREENILIIGSGNIVHNLGLMIPHGKPFEWATSFQKYIKQNLEEKNESALIDCKRKDHANAKFAVPTDDHFLPLLYVFGASERETPEFFCESIDYASISMMCVAYGLRKED